MTFDGTAASARSNSSRSIPVARLENTLKFTPSATTAAPSGPVVPARTVIERSERFARFSVVVAVAMPHLAGESRSQLRGSDARALGYFGIALTFRIRPARTQGSSRPGSDPIGD